MAHSSVSRILQVAIGLAISAVCAVLVLRGVEWQKLSEAVRGIRVTWLVAAALINVAAISAAGLRWRLVARPNADLSRHDAIEIVMIGSFTNLALSRAGDLARAVLTGRRSRRDVGPVLGAMVVERFADVAMLLIVGVALSAFVALPAVVRAGLAAVALTTIAAVLSIWYSNVGGAIVGGVIGILSRSLAAFVAETMGSLSAGLRRSLMNGHALAVTVWTVAIWALSALAIFCTITAFSLPVGWVAALFVMVVTNLGGVIPSSPGGIGVYHYLTVLALSLWLPDPSAPLGFAIVNHAQIVLLTTICGSISLFRQGLGWRAVSPAVWSASTAAPNR